jgi:hypothetical protein
MDEPNRMKFHELPVGVAFTFPRNQERCVKVGDGWMRDGSGRIRRAKRDWDVYAEPYTFLE